MEWKQSRLVLVMMRKLRQVKMSHQRTSFESLSFWFAYFPVYLPCRLFILKSGHLPVGIILWLTACVKRFDLQNKHSGVIYMKNKNECWCSDAILVLWRCSDVNVRPICDTDNSGKLGIPMNASLLAFNDGACCRKRTNGSSISRQWPIWGFWHTQIISNTELHFGHTYIWSY